MIFQKNKIIFFLIIFYSVINIFVCIAKVDDQRFIFNDKKQTRVVNKECNFKRKLLINCLDELVKLIKYKFNRNLLIEEIIGSLCLLDNFDAASIEQSSRLNRFAWSQIPRGALQTNYVVYCLSTKARETIDKVELATDTESFSIQSTLELLSPLIRSYHFFLKLI